MRLCYDCLVMRRLLSILKGPWPARIFLCVAACGAVAFLSNRLRIALAGAATLLGCLIIVLLLPVFSAIRVWVQGRQFARKYKRLAAGQCIRCGYDLTGNVSGTCPECGIAIS